jgi:hypothetical protein
MAFTESLCYCRNLQRNQDTGRDNDLFHPTHFLRGIPACFFTETRLRRRCPTQSRALYGGGRSPRNEFIAATLCCKYVTIRLDTDVVRWLKAHGRGYTRSGRYAKQGWSVSLSASGDTAIVGGPWDTDRTGAAWVFVRFAGIPRSASCHGQSVSTLAEQYGWLGAAAAALGYSSVQTLQNAIAIYCAG